jgi:hypothetical protein
LSCDASFVEVLDAKVKLPVWTCGWPHPWREGKGGGMAFLGVRLSWHVGPTTSFRPRCYGIGGRARYDDPFSGLVTGHAENSGGRMAVNGRLLG